MSMVEQTGKPTVTVVIVNYNAGRLLSDGAHAALPQVLEVVVVDNASSDSSIEDCARQFVDEPRLKILRNEANLGFAAAWNIGFFNAVCDFVLFGSKLVKASDPTLLDGVGDAYHISGIVWRERHGVPQQEGGLVAREMFSPCAAAALYRRQALVDIGGFDEDFFCYVEDVDLGFRLRLAGHKAMYVPDAVVHHVGSGTTGGQHSDFSMYHGHRNLVWTYVKNVPGILFWLLLPLHAVMNLASVLWFALQGRSGVILRAKRDALLGLSKMWRKRQAIQSTRVATVREIWRLMDKQAFPAR